jgi:hypothetical protein
VGAGVYTSVEAALQNRKPVAAIAPGNVNSYRDLYSKWKAILLQQMNHPGTEPALSFNFN